MSDPLAAVARLPGVPEAVDEAREAVDRLYRHRVLRRARPAVSTESSLRGARASAALEGADVTLDALRRDEVSDPIVQGALRASVEVGRLGPTWRKAPRQVMARLHSVAAAGLVGQDALGRPSAGGPRLDALFGLLETPTKAPALVLAAIVHAELAVLRPFGSADGIVARAAERLTLVEFGLDPKSIVAVEVGHLEQDYEAGLKAYVDGGVAEWVRQCAAAVSLGVRETTAICEAMQRG
ncbi:oxidoreductase [Nonomuraea endophytica]|uniref:Fic family protein n=1 Tax=Nonomuraea endophytica TaxID=714136 RepID=A0A7W7ZZA9_9ACTN|nr:oxidoreductase [Nonomuraea endophytica]MBB5075618.1 Fic family protein [Nonomuraea endophytica]